MEEKDNEDMQSGYDQPDEEMSTEVSNGDDNNFNASDDDENRNNTQPTNMKPFNIDEDVCSIMKKISLGNQMLVLICLRMIKMKKWLNFLEIYLGCMIFI